MVSEPHAVYQAVLMLCAVLISLCVFPNSNTDQDAVTDIDLDDYPEDDRHLFVS